MAKNDTIILDGILDDRVLQKLPSNKRDESFEYFAIEQVLKDFNFSTDDLLSGRIDGSNDGGIDGFYIIVNGHLLSDPLSFYWPKTNAELEIYLITCKHHETFKQAPFDNIAATLTEIFDLGIERKNLKGIYNNALLKSRDLFKTAYRKLAARITTFNIKVCYASRGDISIIGESIISRGQQIKKITEQLFGACTATILYYGSTELVELNRKVPNFSLELPFVSVIGRGERYILLSNLEDYKNFVTDDSNKLRRYLFDSNVRDYMGLNRVNEDIKTTLENEESPDFWWLNNGITILATSAQVIGNSIHIEDVQIVNGLQTTESIYKYFSFGKKDSNKRAVLVKVIVSKENEVRDSIIRATNNQTNVELSSLHATDKIQRDIEDILFRNGIYYERRANFYFNQGIKASQIITPLYIASGFLSLVMKSPDSAPLLKSKFMRKPESYEKIFSETIPIDVWPQIVKILKRTDNFIESIRPSKKFNSENFLKKWRHLVSFLTISRLLGKFNFDIYELIDFDVEKFTDTELNESWDFINITAPTLNKSKWFAVSYTYNVLKSGATKYNIKGIEGFERKKRKDYKQIIRPGDIPIDYDFALKVDKLLPKQPWKPGVHLEAANHLNCPEREIYSAIEILIKKGKRYRQKDGILYDKDGHIIEIDVKRVDPKTKELLD